jgi:hypothetical protein
VQVILLGAVLVVVVALLLVMAVRTHNQKGRRSAAAHGARPSDGTATAARDANSTAAADRSLAPSFSSSDRGATHRSPAAARAPRVPLAPVPTPAQVVPLAPPPAVPVFDRFAVRALGPAGTRSRNPTPPTPLPLLSVPPPPPPAEDPPD